MNDKMVEREVADYLRAAKRNRDAMIRRFRRMANQNAKIRCRGGGCDGCCYQLVMASAWEGALIARYLTETGQDDLCDAVIDQGFKIVNRYFPDSQITTENNEEACVDWYNQRNPCLFLSDRKCVIYGLRPIACSSYLVTSDPALCYAAAVAEVVVVDPTPVFAWVHEVERRLIAMLTGRGPEEKFVVSAAPLGYAIAAGLFVLRGEAPPLSTRDALSA